MFQNINARPAPDQIVARLTREATLNLASHLLRLELATEKFSLSIEGYKGVERDYVVGVIYSMNENIALLRSLGQGELLDALLINNIDGKEWYDEAIKLVHGAIQGDPAILEDSKVFAARWEIVRPSPKPPANVAALDKAFKDDDDEGLAKVGVSRENAN